MRQDAMTTSIPVLRVRNTQPFAKLALMMILLAISTAVNLSCARRTQINAPLASPYLADKTWAVAPLSDDSGTTVADGAHLSDLLARELQQVYRINVLPVNRVIEAMYALQIERIQTVHDAQAVVRLLNIDGLIVGNITAYDPYSPPVLGMTLQLYTSGDEFNSPNETNYSLNSGKGVRTLGAAASDTNLPGVGNSSQPVASATAIVNAADNAIRIDLRSFAEGRTDPDTALGWREYLYSMDAYAQYVGHRLIKDLLTAERRRMGNRSLTAHPSSTRPRNEVARMSGRPRS